MSIRPACTPIAAVSREDDLGAKTAADSGQKSNDFSPSDTPPGTSSVATAELSAPCDEPGKRACASRDQRTPLLCKDATWQAQAGCGQLERCEKQAGAQLGSCVPIASECLSHMPGEDFCDGEFLQSCADLVQTGARSCTDPRRRCKEVDNKPRCVCAERWTETASGECEVPTTCSTNNGGCDTSTSCDASGGQRICGPCQAGFEGSGELGCHAQLSLLNVEDLQLVPEFSPDVHSYRIALPLLRQRVRVSAATVAGVTLDFDGVEQQPGSVWQSAPLTLGEHRIAINLSATQSGLKSQYELLITRSGVQDAYLKASQVDAGDQFGGGLAAWGDTLAVGAPQEDSASRDNPSDDSLQDSGAVYIFVRQGNKWTQTDYVKADQPRANDFFGGTIVLRDDTMFVGATGANALGTAAPHVGSVQVFKRQAANAKWSYLTTLAAPAGVGVQDLFGFSIAADDKRVIVGAPFEQGTERFSGGAYAYTRDGDTFSEPVHVTADKPLPSGLFGWALALEADTLVVGAPQLNTELTTADTGSGTAYVFSASGNHWTQLQELPPDASLEDGATMGWSVAIAGETVAVGAPRARAGNEGQSPGDAFIYARASGGGWSLKQSLQAGVPRVSDWFAWQVALTPSALLIGAAGDNSGSSGLMGDPKNQAAKESGALYLYALDNDQWVNTTFVKTSNPRPADDFGGLIAVSGDTIVCGATGESSDAMGIDGTPSGTALARAGAAYVFR